MKKPWPYNPQKVGFIQRTLIKAHGVSESGSYITEESWGTQG